MLVWVEGGERGGEIVAVSGLMMYQHGWWLYVVVMVVNLDMVLVRRGRKRGWNGCVSLDAVVSLKTAF